MDIREKKHLVLLGFILLLLGIQPFAHGVVSGFILYDVLAAIATVVILLVVFDDVTQRRLTLLFAAPAVASNILLHFVPPQYAATCALTYHFFAAAFFGIAVGVILHNAFRKRAIAIDQIIAGINGFLIACVAWGNLFLAIELLAPCSYAMNDRVAAEMEDVHSRRFEFNHMSFAILSGIGFDDLTPAGRIARTLAWFEASFGLFYVAVIIGLLVGLKMSPGSSDDHSASS